MGIVGGAGLQSRGAEPMRWAGNGIGGDCRRGGAEKRGRGLRGAELDGAEPEREGAGPE